MRISTGVWLSTCTVDSQKDQRVGVGGSRRWHIPLEERALKLKLSYFVRVGVGGSKRWHAMPLEERALKLKLS